jgi:transcriptional regulator with XRE-family HTH domain
MARAALGLTVERLARDAVVPPEAIAAMEQGHGEPEAAAKLRATFEAAGVAFLGEDGVTFRDGRPDAARTLPLEELNAANDE